ncbi:MAG: DUF2062 domain-containing protein [Luteolibacter sp.]
MKSTYRMLRHKRLRHRSWWRRLTEPLFDRQLWMPCRDTVASGLAVGFFFAMMAMPFQMIAAALTAMRFRGNVPFAVAGCWVSNLATHIPIWVAQEWLGDWMRDKLNFPMPEFLVASAINIPESWENFYVNNPAGKWMQHTVGIAMPENLNAASFLLGMMVSGFVLAALAYPLVHLFSAIMPHHLPVIKKEKVRVKGEKKEA